MGVPFEDDDDLTRAKIARPTPTGTPLTLRGVPSPGSTANLEESAAKIPSQMGASLRTATQPEAPSPLEKQTSIDRAQQSNLDKGSGISQIANPWARNTLRGVNVLGSVAGAIIPQIHSVMGAIPGTEEHHQRLVGQNNQAIAGDEAERVKEAQSTNLEAQPELKQETIDAKNQALDAKTQANQTEEQRKQEHDTNGLVEQYRKLGLKYDPATKQPTPISYEEMTPQEQGVHDLKAAQTEASDAKAHLDQMKGDPNSPVYQMQLKRLQVAQQNAQNAASRLQLSTAEFGNKLHEQNLMKPSGQTQSRGSAAQSALDVMPKLQQLVQKNGAQMGAIMGRINKGEIKIGDVDPDVAELYGAMKSFYALQPAVHGFRNAEFVKDFEHAIGTLERDPKAFLAGMQGLKPTMEAVASEGKTFHKRIVEGEPVQPQGGQGTAQPSAKKWDPIKGRYE